MTQELNHSRQLYIRCGEILAWADSIRKEYGNSAELDQCLQNCDLARSMHIHSVKFMLPPGGRIFDDNSFKGLDESLPLHLPFPTIALEYRCTGRFRGPNEPLPSWSGELVYEDESFVSAPKRIIYATETPDAILILVAFFTTQPEINNWRILPRAIIPRTGYMKRSVVSANESPAIMLVPIDESVPLCDYSDEVNALLCFLSALSCSNVGLERVGRNKTGAIKSALPFDQYHVLKISLPGNRSATNDSGDGNHRSPREHLRRGHIRTLHDGRRVWVNAAIVGAQGGKSGAVMKSYTVSASTDD